MPLPLLACLLLAAGCGTEPPEVLEIRAPDEAQVLFVEAKVTVPGTYQGLQVIRIAVLDIPEGEPATLRPREIHVWGEAWRPAPDVEGGREYVATYVGIERAAQAIFEPLLMPFWSAARVSDGVLEIGNPLPNGGADVFGAAGGVTRASVEDLAAFHLRAVPDAALLLVASAATGRWEPEAQRTFDVVVHRGDERPAWKGRCRLRRRSRRAWNLLLDVDLTWQGLLEANHPWTISHHVEGFVGLDTNGHVSSANLENRTYVRDGDEAEVGRAHCLLEASPWTGTVSGHEADDYARLLALGCDDRPGLLDAVLEATATSARRHVRALRPKADLEGVRLVLWDRSFDPDTGRGPTRPTAAGLPLATWANGVWAEDFDRLFRTPGGTSVREDDGSDAQEAPPDDAAREIGFADPTHDLIAVRPAVTSFIQVLAHEYAHIASERLGQPDFERIGVGPTTRDGDGVDADGAMALAALEEAQAEITGWAAAFALDEGHEQRALLAWFEENVGPLPRDDDDRIRLRRTIYETSMSLLAAGSRRHEGNLDSLIARTWATFTYQTRQVLFPEEITAPSVLWPKARALREKGATGVTRMGAWNLLLRLDRSGVLPPEEALAIVRSLEDDVLVRGEKGELWVTRWTDEEAAERFLEKAVTSESGTIQRTDRHVFLTVGAVPEEGAWRRFLVSPEEDPAAQQTAEATK